MSEKLSRRDVLGHSGVIAVGLVTPGWLASVARTDLFKQSKGAKVDPNNVLVVCQLSGGNDGLNTVVPYSDSQYYTLRPTLGIPADQALKIGDGLGFHPSMAALKTLFDKGQVAVVQGVGYPNPNRSHFKSMDIWQSADPENKLKYGWVGRTFDVSSGALSPVAGIGLSVEKPLALQADHASIPCFASLADIQAMVGDADSERLLRQIQGADAAAGSSTRVIQQANKSALDAMIELKDRLAKFSTKQTYGTDPFGAGFKQISQIVASSPATRVVYFSSGGFDTHSRQTDSHAKLLKNFSEAVAAFMAEMEAVGRADKVTVLVFSEFGRRAYENGSLGTDHGKAAPMFVIGKNVKGGLYGSRPDLTRLDDGDLPFSTDFRQVYASTLDNWLGVDSKAVLGGAFAHMPMF